jgi:HEAT repeat protein
MRHARLVVCCCLLPLAFVGGCTTLWDDVTSRDFNVHSYLFPPGPMTVLRDSDDGTARAQALVSLTEPAQNGGSEKDQQVYLDILSKSAMGDRDPYCRIAAIRALGRFKDPRAADLLRSVTEQNLTFTADLNNMIRKEALRSLAETGQPVAVRRLIEVAKEPPSADSAQDKQDVLDRRLTAIRGLGKYNYPESNDTLVVLLQTDKDVGVRKVAYDSLRSATGKDLPPNPQEWAEHLHPEMRRPNEAVAREQPNNLWDYVTWPIRLVRGQP